MNANEIMQVFTDTAYVRMGGSEEELRTELQRERAAIEEAMTLRALPPSGANPANP